MQKSEDRSLRNFLEVEEKKLQASLLSFNKNKPYKHCEKTYTEISSIIKMIMDKTNGFNGEAFLGANKKVTFLVGATGSGKSTLLNYIFLGDDRFVVKKDGEIVVKNGPIAEIGGEMSTTLVPNFYGEFLDCAGEEDSRGILAEIINSIIKKKISENVKEAKIIFVSPYLAMKAVGGYGGTFKSALDKNFEFLGNVQHFLNNIGFVITQAGIKPDARNNAIDLLTKMSDHASISHYGDIIKKIIINGYVETFSSPSPMLDVGDVYSPPEWNLDQRKRILCLINKIPYAKIPERNFFNVSTTPIVRDTMSKAFEIVLSKCADYAHQIVKSSMPFKVYGVELKTLSQFFKELSKGIYSDFSTFLKILKWNNFLKINFNKNEIKKLNDELVFLAEFCEKGADKNKMATKNWFAESGLTKLLIEASYELTKIISKNQNAFTMQLKNTLIETMYSPFFNKINSLFESLTNEYRNKNELEGKKMKNDPGFLKNVQKRVFDKMEKVPYKEKVQYIDKEEYVDQEIYTEEESYTEYEQVPVTVHKTRIEEYIEHVPEKRTRMVEGIRPVQKMRDEVYMETIQGTKQETVTEMQPFFKNKRGFAGIGRGKKMMIVPVEKSVDVPYTYEEQRVRQVPYTENEVYQYPEEYTENVPVPKTREIGYDEVVMETREKIVKKPVNKSRPVKKTRDVVKFREEVRYREEPRYKVVSEKVFNENLFNQSLTNQINKISKIEGEIEAILTNSAKEFMKNSIKTENGRVFMNVANMVGFKKEEIIFKDPIQKNFENLLIKWRDTEYSYYFAMNHENILNEIEIQKIKDLVSSNKKYDI